MPPDLSVTVLKIRICQECGQRIKGLVKRGLCPGCYSALRRDPFFVPQRPGRIPTQEVLPEIHTKLPAFMDRARCAGMDTEIFFPSASDSRGILTQANKAARVCARCPVIEECRKWAEAFPETARAGGVFAGTFYRSNGRRELLL